MHISYQDGLPLSYLEAMASGLPIIANRVGGIPEIADDSFCQLTGNDEQSIAENLNVLLRDEALRQSMGDCARRSAVERFSWGRMAAELTPDDGE